MSNEVPHETRALDDVIFESDVEHPGLNDARQPTLSNQSWEPPRSIIGALALLFLSFALTGVLTVTWFWVGLGQSGPHPDEDCAGFRQRAFPLQPWCPSPSGELVASESALSQVWSVGLAGAAFLAFALTLLLTTHAGTGPRRWRWITGYVAFVTIATVVMAHQAVYADPPRPLEERQANGGLGAPAASSRAIPEPTLARAREVFDNLTIVADQQIGAQAVRPLPITVSESTCVTTENALGTQLLITGQYTAHDLALARDNAEFLLITQQNEEIAGQISLAWQESGLLGEPEPLHGEWFQGSPEDQVDLVELAHLGFEVGIGDIRVTSHCPTQ